MSDPWATEYSMTPEFKDVIKILHDAYEWDLHQCSVDQLRELTGALQNATVIVMNGLFGKLSTHSHGDRED